MDGYMDVQIPPVFYRTSSPSGRLPKNELCEGPGLQKVAEHASGARMKQARPVGRKRQPEEKNNCKSVRWSAVPVPCLSKLCLKLRGEQGSGPEGVDDLCFHTYGEFSPPSSPSPP